MGNAAIDLYGLALQTALVLALPVVALVAVVGVIIALMQTIMGLQDQNLSFGPKIIAVAALLGVGGMSGLALLSTLLRASILALPHLAG